MRKNGFDMIFYGLFFILINIPLGGIDILPDFIGYTLIYFGYERLKSESVYFSRVRKFILLLIVISLVSFYRSVFIGISIADTEKIVPELIIGLISFIFIMINFHDLFYGIKDYADKKALSDVSNDAILRWKQFIISYILSTISIILLFIGIPEFLYIISLVIMIFYTYVIIKIMKLIKKCSKALDV
jgi:hypothetical protein